MNVTVDDPEQQNPGQETRGGAGPLKSPRCFRQNPKRGDSEQHAPAERHDAASKRRHPRQPHAYRCAYNSYHCQGNNKRKHCSQCID
jgi:hypothetical protein